MNHERMKHTAQPPNPRTIRRACAKELYRTVKRLRQHIASESVKAAEELYTRKVIGHLEWITMHQSNRKLLADWWEEAVCPEIAALWQVDPSRLSNAFRDAFGG